MVYVRQQNSQQLRAHVRSLQKVNGWSDPLTDRLFQEIEAIDVEIETARSFSKALSGEVARLRAELRSALFQMHEAYGVVGDDAVGRVNERMNIFCSQMSDKCAHSGVPCPDGEVTTCPKCGLILDWGDQKPSPERKGKADE